MTSFIYLNNINHKINIFQLFAVDGGVGHSGKWERKDEADQLTVGGHESELIVVVLGSSIDVEAITTSVSLSHSDVLDEIGVGGKVVGDEDGLTEGAQESNQDVVLDDVSTEVIQVTTGEGSHDDLNISTHFISDSGHVLFDGGGGTEDDFFEFTGTELAGFVDR